MDISLDLDKSSPTYKDFKLLNNDLVMTSDVQTGGTNPILQNILQRVSLFRGEWFMNNTVGIPWLQLALVKNPDLATIEALVLNTILGTLGVVSVSEFSFEPNFRFRTLKMSFNAVTTQGDVDYSGTISTGVISA